MQGIGRNGSGNQQAAKRMNTNKAANDSLLPFLFQLFPSSLHTHSKHIYFTDTYTIYPACIISIPRASRPMFIWQHPPLRLACTCNIKVHQKIPRTAPQVAVFSCIFHRSWPTFDPFQRKMTVRLSRFKTSLDPQIPPHVLYWLRSDTKYVKKFATLQLVCNPRLLWLLDALGLPVRLHHAVSLATALVHGAPLRTYCWATSALRIEHIQLYCNTLT